MTDASFLEKDRSQGAGTGPEKKPGLKGFWELERNRELFFYWSYGVLIALAELIVSYYSIKLGIFIHFLLLGGVLFHSAYAFRTGTPWLYLTLALAPLTRILSLSMPLTDISPILWYFAICTPLFAAAVGVMRILEFKPAYVGLNLNNLPMQFVIALLGFPLGFIEYHILKPQPLVSSFNMPEILLWFLVLLIFTGLLEELIFRGIMYRAAFKAVGAGFALFYVSFIFAALHITHLSFWDVIFVFLVALLFTRIFVWQKSIVGLTVAHGLTNTTLYIICPLVF